MGKLDLINALEDNEGKDFEFSEETDTQQEESLKREGKVLLDIQQKKIQKLDEEIKDLQQDRKQRQILSYSLFGFMCIYMAAVLVVIFFCGFELMHLSDTILGFLLTTTLADVIGIFGFVAKYLYHNK
jgi:hypothetical protein